MKSELMTSQSDHSSAISKLKEIAPTKNMEQMIMSMRDELHEIGEGAPELSKNREEIKLFKCKFIIPSYEPETRDLRSYAHLTGIN
jgi:hypothetical protein